MSLQCKDHGNHVTQSGVCDLWDPLTFDFKPPPHSKNIPDDNVS